MERLRAFLDKRRQESGLRKLFPVEKLGHGRLRPQDNSLPELLDFSSNDYLALSEHPRVLAASRAALERLGASSGASRLMSGNLAIHQELEQQVARLKGQEAALLFGSGYLANTGVIPALVGRGDVVFSDRLNHASIHDGCRLSGARTLRFRHNDPNHLEDLLRRHRGGFRRSLVVVESIYSMDGDRCPLAEIVGLKEKHDSLLLVDEAHATGVFGPNGGGVIEEEGLSARVDLSMGTFGKALGSYGAYLAASRLLVDYLVNCGRSFIYSTALPPAVVGACLGALEVVATEPERRAELLKNSGLFRRFLQEEGIAPLPGNSQIVPVLVGEAGLALALSRHLLEHGVFTAAVRPPTVPAGTARLRFSVTCHLDPTNLQTAAHLLAQGLANNPA